MHSNKLQVSAIVLTKNEEANIGRCLSSLTWADEVVVIDAFSTDKTVQICEEAGVRLVQHEWSGFRSQRNFSLTQTKHNWVLVVDADEQCSPELESRIRTFFSKGGPDLFAYKVRRQEFFLGKAIHYGVWNPSYQDRFFNKRGVEYVNEVHEYPVFAEPPGFIHEPLIHTPGFAPERFLEKMNKYTTIEALDRVRAGQRTNWFTILFAFPAMFYKNFFYYGAYKDGMHGFIISILEGLSRAVRHIKIWQYSRELKE